MKLPIRASVPAALFLLPGLLAAQIIATGDAEVLAKLQADREKRRQKVLAADEELQGK